MTQADMESELEEYLSNIGLSSNLLKSTSSTQVDDHAQPSLAAAALDDDSKDSEDDDIADVSRPEVDATAAVDGGQVNRTPDGAERQTAVSADDRRADFTASLADIDCCTATNNHATHADCDNGRENLTDQHAALLSPDNGDGINHAPTTRTLSSDVHGAVLSSRRQTVTTNGHAARTDHGELSENVTAQPSGSRSAVVFSTVPRHVDGAATLPPSSRASSSSSCTIMLSGEAADVVGSSPSGHRAAGDGSERPGAEVAGRARKTSLDARPYTSTIIRCSASSAPVIATSSAKSRDVDAPAAAVDDRASPPHVKTAPNYVSVVQIGSATSASSTLTERRDIQAMTMSAESVSGSAVTLGRSSPLTGHVRVHTSTPDVASCTPIKSSLKKVSPGHAKNKSVSFSAGSPDDSDVVDEDVSATTGDTPVVRPRDAPHPSPNDAVLHRDRPDDGIGARRALVSDSGIFCEPDDDVVSDDGRVTATSPSRRTTVVVSGGMAAVKNSPRHRQLAELTDGSAGSRARDAGGGPGSVRRQHASASSAAVNVTDTKHRSTENTTRQVRHKTSNSTQTSQSKASPSEATSSKQRKRSQRSSKQCRTQ